MGSETGAGSGCAPRRDGRRWGGWCLGLGVAALTAVACLRARARPLWYDELFTFYLAQLPTVGDLWAALAGGADLNPPLHYLAVRGTMALLGPGPLALRLPSVAGYAVMSLCLYRFAARRLGPSGALAAAAFPAATLAFDYAHEGRPYGLVLGLAGLALVAWQVAAEGRGGGRRRRAALGAMALALAAAVSCHFFAVLIFVPIGLGELARARRRLDAATAAALVAGLIPLAFFGPILRASALYRGGFWAKPTWAHNAAFYAALLKNAGVPLLLAVAALAALARFGAAGRRDREGGRGGGREPVPAHEWAAALGLVALPVVGFLVAKATSAGSFTERYALATVLGFGLLIAYTADRLDDGRRRAGAVLALAFFGWFLLHEGFRLRAGSSAHATIAAGDFRPVEGSGLPLVISRPMMYLQSYHDLPPDLAGRLVFVARGRRTEEVALRALSRWVPLKVVEERPFLGEHSRFFLCGYPADPFFGAMLGGDADAGAGPRLTMLRSRRFREADAALVLVERPSGGVPGPGPRLASARGAGRHAPGRPDPAR
jgi:hypothetical protein